MCLLRQHLTQEDVPRARELPQRPPGCASESPGTALQGGRWCHFTEKGKRRPRLREGLGSAGRDSCSAQQRRRGAKLLFSGPLPGGPLSAFDTTIPAVQGAETGSLRCGELIPGITVLRMQGRPPPQPLTLHPGRRTATRRPKQVVLGGWGVGIGSGWGLRLTPASSLAIKLKC